MKSVKVLIKTVTHKNGEGLCTIWTQIHLNKFYHHKLILRFFIIIKVLFRFKSCRQWARTIQHENWFGSLKLRRSIIFWILDLKLNEDINKVKVEFSWCPSICQDHLRWERFGSLSWEEHLVVFKFRPARLRGFLSPHLGWDLSQMSCGFLKLRRTLIFRVSDLKLNEGLSKV